MSNISGLSFRRQQELDLLADRLGVKFKNIALLNQALTHTSYANESKNNIEHNERLEFLGDAVLELASSTYLYEEYPQLSEGDLTKIRASIVCQATLAKCARNLGMGELLLLGRGEEHGGGRERITNLEDAFEAVIGAVYLDSGWDIACDYTIRQLRNEFHSIVIGKVKNDFKTELQELVHKHEGQTIVYNLLEEIGPPHNREFRSQVLVGGIPRGEGIGRSKKEAEQHAAAEALSNLNKASSS